MLNACGYMGVEGDQSAQNAILAVHRGDCTGIV